MDDKIVFKTAAVGGFEKKAVLDYIYQMTEDNDFAQQQLKAKIAELEGSLSKFESDKKSTENNSSDSNEQTEILQKQVESLKEQISKLESAPPIVAPTPEPVIVEQEDNSELIESLNTKIRGLNNALAQKSSEVELKSKEISDIVQKYADLEKKREEIEKASFQLGRVMLDARADADSLVSNASEQAREIEMQSRTKASKTIDAASKEAEIIRNQALSKADTAVTGATEEAESIIAKANAVKDETVSSAKDLAEATVYAAEIKAEESLEQARTRVANLLNLNSEATKDAVEQMEMLRDETSNIRVAFEETLLSLGAQIDTMEKTYVSAQNALDLTIDNSPLKALDKLPQISVEDVAMIKEEIRKMEEATYIAAEEAMGGHTHSHPSTPKPASTTIFDEEENQASPETSEDTPPETKQESKADWVFGDEPDAGSEHKNTEATALEADTEKIDNAEKEPDIIDFAEEYPESKTDDDKKDKPEDTDTSAENSTEATPTKNTYSYDGESIVLSSKDDAFESGSCKEPDSDSMENQDVTLPALSDESSESIQEANEIYEDYGYQMDNQESFYIIETNDKNKDDKNK